MKVDIFPHILPAKYKEAIEKKLHPAVAEAINDPPKIFPALTDVDARFAIMDRFEDYVQVLNITVPFIERVAEPEVAAEIARIGNDELAELVAKYPDRFIAAIGNLPMNDLDSAFNELDRIINGLHFKGIQICTNINGKPLDSPEFMPLYEKMQEFNLPILIHPERVPTVPDYATEKESKYRIYHIFGWPYDTSAAMVHLVFARVLEKYPRIKFVTHHLGAMIPFFSKRIYTIYRGKNMDYCTKELARPPLEYLKMFYADTSLEGDTPALMCGYHFFGADRIVFGTDMPYCGHVDYEVVKETIRSIEEMEIPAAEKEKIFKDNALKLMGMSL